MRPTPTASRLAHGWHLALLFACALFFSFQTSAQVPGNNDCSNAYQLTCGTTLSGTTVGATGTPGTPVMNSNPAVWYSFVGTGSSVTISSCEANNALFGCMTVYTGSCGNLTAETGASELQLCGSSFGASVTLFASSGTTYYVGIFHLGNAPGPFNLSMSCGIGANSSDSCSGAVPLTCGVQYAGTTLGSNLSPTTGCVANGAGVWYHLVGTGGQTTINICKTGSWIARSAVFTGSCSNLSCFSSSVPFYNCANNGSIAHSFASTAGTDYYIYVFGIQGTAGNFTLWADCNAATAVVDVGVVDATFAGTDCGNGNVLPVIEFDNPGTVTVTNLDFSFSIDNGPATTINIPISIAPGASATYQLPMQTLAAGTHTVQADVLLVNGQQDTFTSNNSLNDPVFVFNGITSNAAVTNLQCANSCDGAATISVTGTGPFSYVWGNTQATGSTASNLCAGSYFVSVTDANGCMAIVPFSISPAANAMSVSLTTVPASCDNTCDGVSTAVVTGGSAPYNYTWSDGQQTATATGLCTGTQLLDVTDAAGCYAGASTVVTALTALSPGLAASDGACDNSCDGSIVASPTGGSAPYTYAWSNSASTTDVAPDLCDGLHEVTITEASGCSVTASATISSPDAINVVSSSADASCAGICDGSAIGLGSGGTGTLSYLWNDPAMQTTASATNLCPGTHELSITDGNGCVHVTPITIGANTNLLATFGSTSPTCPGDCDVVISVTPSTGTAPFAYLWTDPAAQTTATATGLCAGTYSVQLTDADGCIGTFSSTINEPDAATPTQLAATTCNAVLADLRQSIEINPVLNATAYELQITDLGSGSIVYVPVLTPSNTASTFPALQPGGSYEIAVRYVIGQCTSAWGPTCTVTIADASVPQPNVQTPPGGLYITSMAEQFFWDEVAGAVRYSLNITNAAGMDYNVLSPSGNPTANFFSMDQVPGVQYATAYEVRVQAQVDGSWGPYGAPGTVITPAEPNGIFDPGNSNKLALRVFPNPTNQAVNVQLLASELGNGMATVQLLDLTGRALETQRATAVSGTSVFNRTGQLAAGTYIIRVQQDGRTAQQLLVIQ